VYNIALAVTSALQLPLSGVNQLFPTVASRLYSNKKRDQLSQIYSTVVKWVFTATALLVAIQIAYRSEILSLFGPEFIGGGTVLLLFAFAQLINAFSGPSNFMLMMTDHQYVVSFNNIFIGIVNIVLNYIFILEFGFIGAALASAGILMLINIVRIGEVYYLEGFFPYDVSFIKPFLIGCVAVWAMSAIGDFFSGTILLVIGSGFGIILYICLTYYFIFDKRDKLAFKEMVS
jgi:O-antigen/teichoic acid export membrane protein